MDAVERAELELGLPEGPVPWWEVRAEVPDGCVPEPPPLYPPDVEAWHFAKVTVLRVQAGSGSAALARAEELLGTGVKWTVGMVTAGELIAGR